MCQVNNLAVLLNDLGRSTGNLKMLSEAEPLKREALQGCREVLGNRHPHTLASIANLADLLMQLAPCDPRAIMEAEPLAKESLQVKQRSRVHMSTFPVPSPYLPRTFRVPSAGSHEYLGEV